MISGKFAIRKMFSKDKEHDKRNIKTNETKCYFIRRVNTLKREIVYVCYC